MAPGDRRGARRASTRPSPPRGEPSAAASPSTVRIGRIAGPHGLKGALRLRLDNPDSDTLRAGSRVQIKSDGVVRERRLASFERVAGNLARITIDGVADRGASDALSGAVVSVAMTCLPAKSAGEFYYFETLGCDVNVDGGARLGSIAGVFNTGANDVWVVRDGDREVLIPVIADVVKSIDLDQRCVTIVALPGLLD
ncbi:MAG: ribosome maturation factor RimM [Candidatus Binataceae bacterium]